MKRRGNNMKNMYRSLILLLTVVSLFAFSCSTRKNKVESTDLIPKKELVAILTDVYMADGLLSLPKVRHDYSELDSTTVYLQVIEKHGFTKEKMDRTMKYYFIRKPKDLVMMYDEALGALSELESRAQSESALLIDKISNLWPGKVNSLFPGWADQDTSDFTAILDKSGKYTLYFDATVFPDDQSVNPCLSVFTCHPDSAETGVRKYSKTVGFIKDGLPHKYELQFPVPDLNKRLLKGTLYDSRNLNGSWEKHAFLENIYLVFSSEIL
jgi:hypothetical protein